MPTIPPRVLLVEDHEDSRVMLSALLKFSDIEVRAVATAHEVLSFMREEEFDLYLLDARLPDLDGFELCRRIRKFAPRTPIVFYSGAAQKEDIKEAIAAGASAYVTKPDVAELLETVNRLVSVKKIVTITVPPVRSHPEAIPCHLSQTTLEPVFVLV